MIESGTYGSLLYSILTTTEIYTPIEDYERLHALNEEDKELIFQVLLEIYPPKERDLEITNLEFRLDPVCPTVGNMTDKELLEEIEMQRNLMIVVATGGPRINTVNEEYRKRGQLILSELKARGLTDPNPYVDMLAWYGK